MDTAILIAAVVILVAIGAATLGLKLGLPTLLLFLGVGVVLGDSGLGIHFSNAKLAQELGFLALVLILAEGGLATKWKDIRPRIGFAATLATVGIVVSVGLIACFVHVVLGFGWTISILLGAVLSPTDSAAVFSVLRNVPLPASVSAALEGESGLNDAPTVVLVVAATGLAMGTMKGGVWGMLATMAFELIGGLLLGIALGVLGSLLLRSVALPSSGLVPLATMAWAFLAYAMGAWIHVSGFAAVYVASVLLGNSGIPHKKATASFAEGIGWISQIGLFVMLGLLATPARLTIAELIAATLIMLFLLFVARPISVLVSALAFGIPKREMAFVSWAGLRGAVPIILTTIPLAAGLPEGTKIFDIIFIFVILSTLVQGPGLPWIAQKLGLVDPRAISDLDIDVAPLEKFAAVLMYAKVPQESGLDGVSIAALKLPPKSVVSLLVRGDDRFVPHQGDSLRGGDELLILCPSSVRPKIEARLHDLDLGYATTNAAVSR